MRTERRNVPQLNDSYEDISFLLHADPSCDAWGSRLLLTAISLAGADGGSLRWFESRSDALNLAALRVASFSDFSISTQQNDAAQGVQHHGQNFLLFQNPVFPGLPEPFSSRKAKASLHLSLRSRTEVYGVIHLACLNSSKKFGLHQMELLNTFGSTVALIVENKRTQNLLLSENESLRQMSEGAAELDIALSPEQVSSQILKRCLQISGMDRGVVMLSDSVEMKLAAFQGLDPLAVAALSSCPINSRESPGLVELLRQGSVTLVNLAGHPGLAACFPEHLKSLTAFALVEGGELIGTVIIGSEEKARSWEHQLLQAVGPMLADQASRSLRACQLVTTLRHKSLELEQATQSLVRSEKLATVGQLAAAVAHQIRNPLSVINANVELMMEELGPAHALHSMLDTVSRKVSQTDSTIRELLELARPLSLNLDRSSLKERLESVAKFILPKCRLQGVELELNCSEGLPAVWLDETQFERCLLDLTINSLQQMAGGGQLIIGGSLENEKYVRLWVEDTGPGIRDGLMDRIFEPFFSLRPGGTGLGLYNVRRICHEMGIAITVHNRHPTGSSRGACFNLMVPMSLDKPAPILPKLQTLFLE